MSHPVPAKGCYQNKSRTLLRSFAREYGEEALLDCLERNEKQGVVYHRSGITGDYDDFTDIKDLMTFILTGHR